MPEENIFYDKVYCIGSSRLKELIKELLKNYNVKTSCINIDDFGSACNLFVIYDNNIDYYRAVYSFLENKGFTQVDELTFCKLYISRLTNNNKFIGFVGNSNVDLSLLKDYVPNYSNYSGRSRHIIYFLNHANELRHVDKDCRNLNIELLSYEEFVKRVTGKTIKESINIGKESSCLKENSSEKISSELSLKLFNKKPFKIVL